MLLNVRILVVGYFALTFLSIAMVGLPLIAVAPLSDIILLLYLVCVGSTSIGV